MNKSLSNFFSNTFIKIIIALFFFLFIKNILQKIGEFLGLQQQVLDTYVFWLICIILLYTFLPEKRSTMLFS